MSKIVEINGEDFLELDKNEREFIRMFNQCIGIQDYLSKYKFFNFEDEDLYNEFIKNCNCLKKKSYIGKILNK